MSKVIACAALCVALAGCADSTKLTRAENTSGTRIQQSDSVYVAVPRNGEYGSGEYSHSGQNTADVIASAFARRIHRVETGRKAQPFEEALASAKSASFSFLIYPTILHWEDRATEWSMIPDKVEIKVEAVDVPTGLIVDTAFINGTSGLATFGGDHPEDLLPKPAAEYVSTLVH